MKNKDKQVYQFKITLKLVKPPVWRRIQVPEGYSFWDLHVAIQDAMGWLDYHLHQFTLLNPPATMEVEIGIPDENDMGWGPEVLPGWTVPIADYFSPDNSQANYEYDFGDGWPHTILLEKILPAKAGSNYPLCIAGKRHCPPEDCGGPWGYENLLEIIADPKHEEHEDMMEWLGGGFDPEKFDPERVRFDDPGKRRRFAFG